MLGRKSYMVIVVVFVMMFDCIVIARQGGTMNYYNTYVVNPLVEENVFLGMEPERAKVPKFERIKKDLPQPFWQTNTDAISCYWKAWEIAFRNVRKPTPKSGFIANFIDPAFNNRIFMWDTAYIVMFGRYGIRTFNFQRSIDNFYAHQHSDGFICREINESDGAEIFHRFDPSSTGPNILPWSEWEYYLNFADNERLERVFPPLLAFYKWFRTWRSWPDGTYYSSGWGCGMDNQPRLPGGYHANWSHGHMSWIDTTLQAILAGKILVQMADIINRRDDVCDIEKEIEQLTQFVNSKMWDDKAAFYYDRFRDGRLSKVKTIGAYWALLADIVPKERLGRFIEHLNNPDEFNRPHRVPTLSADNPFYEPTGGYWRGGIWAPTNYMILRGLSKVGYDDLAYEIAVNHLNNVVEVFRETGTIWENYAPEFVKGNNKKDFVGWSGLSPIAVLFEYVFGLRLDVSNSQLIWDVRLLNEHGVKNYPFGDRGTLGLKCNKRQCGSEEPIIEATSVVPVNLIIKWEGGTKSIVLGDN